MSPRPFLISWNVTRRCNLRCPHCYLDADQLHGGQGDLDPTQALALVTQLGDFCPGAMLVLTGGEPLLRPDIWEIATAATHRGLIVVLGTNGTLLTPQLLPRLQAAGIQGVGISLDSIDPATHDRFRGAPGSWQSTMDAVTAMQTAGLDWQMQITVTRNNYDEIPQLIALAATRGARAANVFFLVCTGRGQQMADITPAQYETMLRELAQAEESYRDRLLVRARCAPHFLRLAAETDPDSALRRGTTSGCIAGTGYLRITPEGEVTPCPYLDLSAGNLRERTLASIWEEDPAFQALRSPQHEGRCGICQHRTSCGGCRARALASTGNLMGEDPWCDYDPSAHPPTAPLPPSEPTWTPEALERLERVPFFLRRMVKSGVERYVREKGLTVITPELMLTLRKESRWTTMPPHPPKG